ncbi:hypothetical protein PBI_SMARTIES_100 [Microbacterium phage Smarties]|uniref:Uncharacterized protein n=1 Tax=Microbacterium phage Ariadne TaxID=2656546 RepID=A0A649VCH7_9CAUD|nr:hypothetical protein QDA10_gp100 [Microbacterium phage Ariadne]QGJ89503.1 hypothetical protein PBI_ARIADNE_100 [Microbacterium phage Ariadne]QGJ91490.1 hypothetical protein PBI_SMARTIES_100 [Microbacterium phage Smarties]
MSNVTRKHLRGVLESMDRLGEPDAAARLDQAVMLATCQVPENMVMVMAKIASQGYVGAEQLAMLGGMGYPTRIFGPNRG